MYVQARVSLPGSDPYMMSPTDEKSRAEGSARVFRRRWGECLALNAFIPTNSFPRPRLQSVSAPMTIGVLETQDPPERPSNPVFNRAAIPNPTERVIEHEEQEF